MSLRLGVDIGGTFTDVFALKDGQTYRGKSDTTHYDLKVGFMNATRLAVGAAGMSLEEALEQADSVVYSTTVGTNALIERKGSKLGLITTKGFEHTVMVGRSRNWADGMPPEKKYDRGRAVRPIPIIPQDRIVGIQERIDNLGKVMIPLRDEDVLEKVRYLVDQGVRGFVVVTLNAFVNPDHERRIREIIFEQYPECYLGHMPVYLSSEISPNSGEYRRSMTVIIDAYLAELTAEHLLRLTEDLRDLGYRRPFFVAKNTGGLSSLSRSQALHLLGSSPAATVVGAEHIGKLIGESNIIVSDMGGTSFDAGLVVEGRDRVYEYDPIIDRFRVQLPFVAHWSVGAGGGSIARVVNGELRVGPDSAGSDPGPVAYARGGEEPTVTDADLVLGYINPENFLGGKLRVDPERAFEAIENKIAKPLGIGVTEAAWDIKRLVDGFMGQEMYRICALISGEDPRDFVVFALGGAGPVHAAGYAEAADVSRVATFPFSSVFGAFSTLTMDILQTYEKTVPLTFFSSKDGAYEAASIEPFNREAAALLELGQRDMLEEGFDMNEVDLQIDVYMSYGQQRQTLPIRMAKTRIDSVDDLRDMCERFNADYAEQFGKGSTYQEAGIDVVQIRLNAVGPVDKYSGIRIKRDRNPKKSLIGSRRAYWGPEVGQVDTPVYRRETLGSGVEIPGPLFCDSTDTVIVVPPGWKFRIDSEAIGWMEKL